MIEKYIILTKKFFKSLVLAPFYKKDFKSIRTFCFFVGYPRSGHSFLGALLDAHPNIIVSIEEDVFHLIDNHFSKNQLFYCQLANSQFFTHKLKNVWSDYSYAVPNAHQGKYDKLLVIGDKKGGRSTILLDAKPKLLSKLKRKVNCELKTFHVIRNPYDDISTMVRRNLSIQNIPQRQLHEDKIKRYFEKVARNHQHKSNPELEILDVYHEDFLMDPHTNLKRMINFLGLEASDEYYDACASITLKKPHKSRFEIEWPQDLKDLVENQIKKYSFLHRYSFDS